MSHHLIKTVPRNFANILRFSNRNAFLIHNFNIQKRFQSNSFSANEILNSNGILDQSVSASSSILSDLHFTQFIENAVTSFHDLTGISWTLNIFISAFMLRMFICFPLRIHNEHIRAKQENLEPEISMQTNEELKKLGFKFVSGIEQKNKLFRRTVKNYCFSY